MASVLAESGLLSKSESTRILNPKPMSEIIAESKKAAMKAVGVVHVDHESNKAIYMNEYDPKAFVDNFTKSDGTW